MSGHGIQTTNETIDDNPTIITTNGTAPPKEVDLRDKPALYGWKTTNERGYTIDEKLSGSGRKLRVIGVGAGASGINLVKSLRDDLKNVEGVVYDKNPEIGGTWWENRYPYVCVDSRSRYRILISSP